MFRHGKYSRADVAAIKFTIMFLLSFIHFFRMFFYDMCLVCHTGFELFITVITMPAEFNCVVSAMMFVCTKNLEFPAAEITDMFVV